MWADRSLTQLICRAGALNHRRPKAGGGQAVSAASGRASFAELTPQGASDSQRT